uniref:Uncharacterized protein n=1 Tax=Alexandrium andersonii TaxID=327968 RepID=A0A7S2GEZ4_9DINO
MSARAVAAAVLGLLVAGALGADVCNAAEPPRASALVQLGARTSVSARSRAKLLVPHPTDAGLARVCFHAETEDDEIQEFCRHMPGTSVCLAKGDSFQHDQEVLPCETVRATAGELQLIAARLQGRAGSAGGAGTAGQAGTPP